MLSSLIIAKEDKSKAAILLERLFQSSSEAGVIIWEEDAGSAHSRLQIVCSSYSVSKKVINLLKGTRRIDPLEDYPMLTFPTAGGIPGYKQTKATAGDVANLVAKLSC